MPRSLNHNLRLGLLALAILVGVAVEKHADRGQVAECETCVVQTERG